MPSQQNLRKSRLNFDFGGDAHLEYVGTPLDESAQVGVAPHVAKRQVHQRRLENGPSAEDFFNTISQLRSFHTRPLRESIGADYPLAASLRSFRDRTNARSVAMNRASISGISLLGSLIDCPLCAARISA
jgi:hypothetical protein